MRLLDQIAQSAAPLWVRCSDGSAHRLGAACDHRARLRDCALRYVLDDDLTRLCAAIAYSDGERLSNCMDLLRVPAQRLWVEWADALRHGEYLRAGWAEPGAVEPCSARRVGLLIDADGSGRRGMFNTLWSAPGSTEELLVAALETHFDFDDPAPAPGTLAQLFSGIPVALLTDATLEPVMQCVRYRFPPAWCDYYARGAALRETAMRIMRESLAAVAHDLPMLLALLLLFAADTRLVSTPRVPARINRKRLRLGKPQLLEHLVLSAPLAWMRQDLTHAENPAVRQSPRWHHVRGHLVRRASTIYWRAPHWRGHLRLGQVKTRTVDLRVGHASGEESAGSILEAR